MKTDFKYPLYRLFFDADGVPCTFIEDVVSAYPNLKEEFEDKTWDIGDYIVLAVADAEEIIGEYIDTLD